MITSQSKVLTVITHYNYNEYLEKSIRSILKQTRSSDAIVVVDDCSEILPINIVKKYENVSLYKTRKNSGPFPILDTILGAVEYDAIMIQDADDWSSSDRLEALINLAVTEQADMVGSQIEVVPEDSNIKAYDVDVPLKPRKALLENPNHHTVYLASTLTSRSFASNLGGFSTGFAVGADSEFIRRAVLAGHVVNTSKRLYFRSVHKNALTQNKRTGFGTNVRKKIQQQIQEAAKRLVSDFKNSGQPDLKPIFRIETTSLDHVLGPSIIFKGA